MRRGGRHREETSLPAHRLKKGFGRPVPRKCSRVSDDDAGVTKTRYGCSGDTVAAESGDEVNAEQDAATNDEKPYEAVIGGD